MNIDCGVKSCMRIVGSLIFCLGMMFSMQVFSSDDKASTKGSCPIAGHVTSNPAKCWNTAGCKPYQISVNKYKCVNAWREVEGLAKDELPDDETEIISYQEFDILEEKNERSRNQCLVMCTAKSSLTGDWTRCGWGRAPTCDQARRGARYGCMRTGWKTPYRCN